VAQGDLNKWYFFAGQANGTILSMEVFVTIRDSTTAKAEWTILALAFPSYVERLQTGRGT
jgi:hypothetical protein